MLCKSLVPPTPHIHSSQPRPTATFPLFVVGMCSSSIRVDSSVSQSPERLHPRPSFAVRGWHEQRDLDRYSSLHHIACNNPPMGCPSYVQNKPISSPIILSRSRHHRLLLLLSAISISSVCVRGRRILVHIRSRRLRRQRQ